RAWPHNPTNPQAHKFQAMRLLVRFPQLFDVKFCCTVQILRRRAIRFRYNMLARPCSINAQGTPEHETSHAELSRHLQQIETARDVARSRACGISLRRGGQNRSQMHNARDPSSLEQTPYPLRVCDVDGDLRAHTGLSVFYRRRSGTIQWKHVKPGAVQDISQDAADESARSRNQHRFWVSVHDRIHSGITAVNVFTTLSLPHQLHQ